ncbi:MAG TPA: deoxyribodipyrimidine photolyase [Solibacterales bacterium]|nr:deoxyribodipyrimidine photolyase [Bryobacterales bacterium]
MVHDSLQPAATAANLLDVDRVEPPRIRKLNDAPMRLRARYVLYWSQMNRRAESNHALQHAIELANRQGLPVLCYEGLTCTYAHANDRIHTFMLEAVPGTAARLRQLGVGYAFYLRARRSDPNDTLYKLARHAAAVVTDDYPVFIAAAHNASVPQRLDVAYFAVDSSCIVPMSLLLKREYAAYTIRPRIHKLLPQYLRPAPAARPEHAWRGDLPPFHVEATDGNIAQLVAGCEIDHGIAPSLSYRGGADEAERHLRHFLDTNLKRYAKQRNEPSRHATSNLSPYLHFGHISSLQVALAATDYAADQRLDAAAFLEELIVRRELAFNFARYAKNPQGFDDLPEWARATMRQHAGDPRDPRFTPRQMEQAATYDPLWNAAQKELLLRGKIHGYYRMYWGKKIIEWSATYEEALGTMIDLHDRYALDGRDPNTYTNILWCFGLHDRPWFDRPIFGVLRYMSFNGMKTKTDIKAYIEEIAELERTGGDPYRL